MGIRREFQSRKLSPEAERERHLKMLGKSLAWYDAKFKEQSGTCAICHQAETRLGLDGAPRPLVVNVASDSLLCGKCSASQNKRSQRARDANYKALKAKKAQGLEGLKAQWVKNRNGLPEAEKVAHENRDTEIVNFMCSISGWITEGDIQPDDNEGQECFRECAREICEEIQQHGTVETCHIADWQDENKKFQDAVDALYFRFGYFAAIPADPASRFLEYAERALHIDPYPYSGWRDKQVARILAVLDGKAYIDLDMTVKCSTSGCRKTKIRAIGEALQAQWWCETHQAERDNAGRADLTKFHERQLTQLRDHNVSASYRLFQTRETAPVFGDTGEVWHDN